MSLELSDQALAAFAYFANPKASGLATVIRRSVTFAKVERRPREIVIDVRAVLMATLLAAGDEKAPANGNMATWLTDWMAPHVKDLRLKVVEAQTPFSLLAAGLDEGCQVVLSDTLRSEIIPRALQIAAATVKREVIDLRHLIVPLVDHSQRASKVWTELGWNATPEDLKAFHQDIYVRLQKGRERGESLSAWREVLDLDPPGKPERPPPTPDPPPAKRPSLSGFRPDRPDATGEDPLGVMGDVEAFAELIAFSGTGMPLSVGVFGGWGSGKSSFMERLEARIEALTNAAPPPSDDPRFLSRIVHIRFNAWHFADANLWASLTSEFFDQLRCGGHRGQRDAIHAELVARVNAHVQDLSKAAAVADHALSGQQQELAEARRQRDRAMHEARGAGGKVLAQALVDSLGGVYQDHKAELARLTGGGTDAVGDMELLVKAAQSSSDAIGKLGVVAKTRWSKPGFAFTAVALVALAGLVGAVLAEPYGPGLVSWVQQMHAPPFLAKFADFVHADRLRAGLGAAIALAAGLALYLAPGLKLLSLVADTASNFAKQLKDSETKQLKKVLAAEARLKAAEVEVEARRKADEWAGRALARYMGPAGAEGAPHLLRYVTEDDPDTRALEKEIGLIGRTRRLFQAVDRIMVDDLERVAQGGAANPEIPERVVIYIDDLDRCTYAQVYAVLQAIHLLLAFGSFVVVAAVDLDWVQKALDDQFGKAPGAAAEPAEATGERDEARTLAYLEKIFHVPFWLRPLAGDAASGEAYAKFVGTLTQMGAPEDRREKAPPEPREPDPPAKPPTAPDPAGLRFGRLFTEVLWPPIKRWSDHLWRKPEEMVPPPKGGPLVAPPPPPPPEAGPGPEALTICPEEIALLSDPALARVASSKPRGVLRMINTYRIVRLRMNEPEAGPPMWPLAALFSALETGEDPELAQDVHAILRALPPQENVLRRTEAAKTDRKRAAINRLFETAPHVEAAFAAAAKARGAASLAAADCVLAARAVRRYSFNREAR